MGRAEKRKAEKPAKGPQRVTLASMDYWYLKGLRANILDADARARAAAAAHAKTMAEATGKFEAAFREVAKKYRFDPAQSWEAIDETLQLVARPKRS